MKAIVLYPSTQEDKIALSDKVASVHVEAILTYIGKLSCAKEQKQKLMKEIALSATIPRDS